MSKRIEKTTMKETPRTTPGMKPATARELSDAIRANGLVGMWNDPTHTVNHRTFALRKRRLKSILSELRRRLAVLYGGRLLKLMLFGSQARGDATPGSDVDILVVLAGDVSPEDEISRTGHILSEISLANDVVVSCTYVSDHRYPIREQPYSFEHSSGRRDDMTLEQEALLRKAKDSLRGARVLADQKLYDFAVSRAYYTMFLCCGSVSAW